MRPHVAAPLDDNLIAVEPFTVLDPSLDVWREGMVDVLAQNFDGAGPLRTVSPTLIVHRGRDGAATPAGLARQVGAGLAVTGRIERSGTDSVRVSASFVDVHTGRPGEVVEYRGRTDHMDVVTDSLTVALLRSLARTQTVGVARGSLAGAKSLSALKALLESEQAYRRGRGIPPRRRPRRPSGSTARLLSPTTGMAVPRRGRKVTIRSPSRTQRSPRPTTTGWPRGTVCSSRRMAAPLLTTRLSLVPISTSPSTTPRPPCDDSPRCPIRCALAAVSWIP
jgi:TolB-like protein